MYFLQIQILTNLFSTIVNMRTQIYFNETINRRNTFRLYVYLFSRRLNLYTALVDTLLILKASSVQRSAAIIFKDEKGNITWYDVQGE